MPKAKESEIDLVALGEEIKQRKGTAAGEAGEGADDDVPSKARGPGSPRNGQDRPPARH